MIRRIITLSLMLCLCPIAVTLLAQQPINPPGPPGQPPVPPMALVARFFELTPDQLEQLKALAETRKDAIEPLSKQVAEGEKALQDLITSSTPDAAAVGKMVLAIQQLREQIGVAQKQFISSLEGILTAEQQDKLSALRRANRLLHVVRAMNELRFF
jgi:Spy/CpxP family protein refolding chaperone